MFSIRSLHLMSIPITSEGQAETRWIPQTRTDPKSLRHPEITAFHLVDSWGTVVNPMVPMIVNLNQDPQLQGRVPWPEKIFLKKMCQKVSLQFTVNLVSKFSSEGFGCGKVKHYFPAGKTVIGCQKQEDSESETETEAPWSIFGDLFWSFSGKVVGNPGNSASSAQPFSLRKATVIVAVRRTWVH